LSTDKKKHLIQDSPVEVVDSRGRALAVVPASEAHRQSLPHRAAMVLFFDAEGKLLLEKRPPEARVFPGRWDVTARDHIRPGEAALDAAKRLAEALYPGFAGQMTCLRSIGPTAGTGFESVQVFRCRVSGIPHGRDVLAVSREELEALAQDFRELFAPAVIHALEARSIYPESE